MKQVAFTASTSAVQPILQNNVTTGPGSSRASSLKTPQSFLTQKSTETQDTHWPEFATFWEQFGLANTSTEKFNNLTSNLSSQTPFDAIRAMHKVDAQVPVRFEGYFLKSHCCIYNPGYEQLHHCFSNALNSGHRIIFMGSGSSGRVAMKLASDWAHAVPDKKDQVVGTIAGGPRAFIKSKEGFEDSPESGAQAIKDLNVSESDVVVVISASGSASFNCGAAKAAKESGANCYYFYNSESIPLRTQGLFDNGDAKKICVPTAPPAISGSTRLHPATMALTMLGASLTKAAADNGLLKCEENWVQNFEYVHQRESLAFPQAAKLASLIHETLSASESNFGKPTDTSAQGYITTFANSSAFSEACIDSTELPPTFTTNPPIPSDQVTQSRKRSEFRAYSLSSLDNTALWKSLCSGTPSEEDLAEANNYCIATQSTGFGSPSERPNGTGNLTIGVIKTPVNMSEVKTLEAQIQSAKANGGKAALIVVTEGDELPKLLQNIINNCEVVVPVTEIPNDPLGLYTSMALKETLNLISNEAMVLSGRVLGNTMIAVNPSNMKLVARCIRITKQLLKKHFKHIGVEDYHLYQMIQKVVKHKNLADKQGTAVPLTIATLLTMVSQNLEVGSAVKHLQSSNLSLIDLLKQ